MFTYNYWMKVYNFISSRDCVEVYWSSGTRFSTNRYCVDLPEWCLSKNCIKGWKRQRDAGFGIFFKKATKMAKRAVKSDVWKMLISKGLEQFPILYQKKASRIRNKIVRVLLLNSNAANNLIRSGSNKLKSKMY